MNDKSKQQFSKPLHLLIDGVDNVGKTTIVNLLSRKLNLFVVKMPDTAEFIKDGSVEKFSKFYNQTLVQFREKSFIMDRGFTSSLVYAKVFKRKDDMSYIEEIEQLLQPKIFILTRTDSDHIYQPLCSDPVFSVLEKNDINSEFLRLAYERDYHVIDTFHRTPEEICNQIIEKINA